MEEVVEAFIQAQEHRPKLEITKAEGIPIIDLSIITAHPDHTNLEPHALDSLLKEIGSACKNWGFFQVINHGVPLEKRQKIEDASRKFFSQRLEDKNTVRTNGESKLGYTDKEHTSNVRDWNEVFNFFAQNPTILPASENPEDKELITWFNQWPEYPPNLREVSEEYGKEMEKLAYKLIKLIALSLSLPKDTFHDCFKEQISLVRLRHYPVCPNPQLTLGVGAHKDVNVLTIVAQDDVGGLEVKRKTDGEWLWVEPTPNAYVINIGDIIKVWSNDIYESVEHRVVVNSERERFSIPFFFGPAHSTTVKPLEELTNEQNPPKYKPYNWGKFFLTRLRGVLHKRNVDNIEVHHFKLPAETEQQLAKKSVGASVLSVNM